MICEKCGAELQQKDDKLVCPKCGAEYLVPTSATPQPAAETASEYITPRGFSSKKNIIIIVLAAVLVLGLGAGITAFAIITNSSSYKASQGIELANRYLSEQNYEQAIIEYEKILEIEPMNVDAYLGLAKAYEKNGEIDKAIEVLREGLEMTDDERIEKRLNKLLDPEESSSSSVDESSSTENNSSKPASSSSNEDNSSSSGAVIERDKFPMPRLIGMTWEEASKEYGDGTLMTLVKQEEYSSEYAEGVIFEQGTIEGRMVKVGSTIVVKVSKGNRKVEIQDFSDRDYETVKKQLERDGFVVKMSSMESDEIAEGRVISTEPPAHTLAEQGSTVVLYVSIGAVENMTIVPILEGMSIEQALNRCDEYGLVPKVEYEDNIEEKGKVLKQSLKPNEKVKSGTDITLTVSSGELPEKEYTWTFTLPQGISGDFQFRLYVDGELSSTKTVNVGLTASKTQSYTIKGQNGTQKTYTIIVRNTANGKEATYIESNITFTGDSIEEHKVQTNSGVFRQLSDT